MQQGQQEPLLEPLPLCHLLLLPLIVFFLVAPSPCLSQTYSSDCAPIPYSCGDINFILSYPFRLHSQPDYCGHPAFTLNCTNNNSNLILPISGNFYKVKSIDTMNLLLTIVNTDFVDQSCPTAYQNTTLDSSLYEYDEYHRKLTIYFNCTAPSAIPVYYEIGCLLGVTGKHSYYRLDNGSFSDVLGRCSSTTVIRMTLEAASLLQNGNISYGAALQEGFGVRWTVGSDWCGSCVSSGGLCGYNRSAPLAHTCFCASASYIDTCMREKGGIFKNKKIIIGLTTGIGVFLFVCLLLLLYLRWHKRMYLTNLFCKKNSFGAQIIEAAIGKYESLAPKRYKYSDVKKITKSFHDKLGQGGYGIVFKGSLKDGRLVAVKVLNDSKENGAEFMNEVSSIGWTSHVNVVSLLGFCFEGSKRALIYEFMHNGSLEKYIYSESAKSTLGWENLYRIAIGIARGLEYLHHGCNTRMVHFDIKPQNILLDKEFCPKISDFGLAKLCSPKDSKLSMPVPRGTIGYIAPEVFSRAFGAASSKSDVYSYGMVVLDMVGARNNKNTRVENTSENYFPDWIYSHLEHDGDLEAWGVTNETQEIAKKLIIVGLWCIQTLPRNRPSMSMVIEMLEGSISDLKVPPKECLSTLESLFGTSSTWVSEEASECM